jgi:hypothetical protein
MLLLQTFIGVYEAHFTFLTFFSIFVVPLLAMSSFSMSDTLDGMSLVLFLLFCDVFSLSTNEDKN